MGLRILVDWLHEFVYVWKVLPILLGARERRLDGWGKRWVRGIQE